MKKGFSPNFVLLARTAQMWVALDVARHAGNPADARSPSWSTAKIRLRIERDHRERPLARTGPLRGTAPSETHHVTLMTTAETFPHVNDGPQMPRDVPLLYRNSASAPSLRSLRSFLNRPTAPHAPDWLVESLGRAPGMWRETSCGQLTPRWLTAQGRGHPRQREAMCDRQQTGPRCWPLSSESDRFLDTRGPADSRSYVHNVDM